MSKTKKDYIFIVNLTIDFEGMPLERINSKRIFHLKNKKIFWPCYTWDASVTLLETDEKDIPKNFPEIEKKNILRLNFELKNCDFGTFFELKHLKYSRQILSILYAIILYRTGKVETSGGEYYLYSIYDFLGGSDDDNPDEINQDSESIRNRVLVEHTFLLLNKYLRDRKNDYRFFDIKKPTLLKRLKNCIKGIFK